MIPSNALLVWIWAMIKWIYYLTPF